MSNLFMFEMTWHQAAPSLLKPSRDRQVNIVCDHVVSINRTHVFHVYIRASFLAEHIVVITRR
jgi:hypothetical protein